MKISLNWIKKYVKVPISDEDLIRLIGARLVEVEGVVDETEKYNNIYVAKVVSAEKIPDTHLTLCQIDVGQKEMVQVVCGAPNVREGMLAAWIAPGAMVPASVHEDSPFIIGKRKMLGKYDSDGMLAGADELDFGDDHSGIVEIDPEMAKPGDLLKDIFELSDKILEIENKSLTHRPDTFGIIGFSREVAGILGQSFDFEYQDTTLVPTGNLKVKILDKDICARYTAVVLEKHGEEKKKYLSWMDTVLSKSGMKPISEIVDVTNFLMLLTGQPLHAFDYDKFVAVGGSDKPIINVRKAKNGEKLELLDDNIVELNENDIVICSGDTPVALAGAMGGKSTMIDETTRNIIIESATFSLYNMRKTQMAHGIFSEAITRFTKGQPPYQCLRVAEAAVEMLSYRFKVAAVADTLEKPIKPDEVEVSVEEINGLLGTDYDEKLIVKTLENVGFEIDSFLGPRPAGPSPRAAGAHPATGALRSPSEETISNLHITSPLWRTDIHIKEDIIEEVGRLLGYDNINPVLPLHGTAEKNDFLELKTRIKNILSSFGANEVLTYSFVSSKLLEKAGLDTKNSYKIINSISPELQLVRQSIVPSLLDKAYMNQKLPIDKFAIFEINKVYQKEWGADSENVPVEKSRLGFVLAERKTHGTAYYKAKYFVEELLKALNISFEIRTLKSTVAEAKPFEKKRAAEIVVNDVTIGIVGEFRSSVKRNFKLNDYLAGFEIDFDKILEFYASTGRIDTEPILDKRDLTVETNKDYGELIAKIKEILAKNSLTADITPLAIYQPESIKHISVHLEFRQKIDEKIMQELESIK
ncbi:phenylalanine--tRNA ligase subunit beta [Candidatus Saccharibacteria bacterium]|nr:phenylalanine--tRNA ligase subunit beta [Candidatus Saccharibacteria bacterium]